MHSGIIWIDNECEDWQGNPITLSNSAASKSELQIIRNKKNYIVGSFITVAVLAVKKKSRPTVTHLKHPHVPFLELPQEVHIPSLTPPSPEV